MSTPTIAQLSALERLPDRPFTDPAHTCGDLDRLDAARAKLRAILNGLPPCASDGQITGRDPDGCRYRVIILDRAALLRHDPIAAVGFCGQRRPGSDPQMMGEVDAELVAELSRHPEMLGYSSHEQPDGNWVNLVLMRSPAAAQAWREGARHIYAARELSPGYYISIRLHSGWLPCGLDSPAIQLKRTTYYDFGCGWWQAVRLHEA